MGQGYGCTCNKCGYSFGANFLFPMVYQKTVDAMRKGEYGEQGKRFFEEHPDGAIECETVVARCSACGEYGQVPELTMYVPKKDYDPDKRKPKGGWSVAVQIASALGVTTDYILIGNNDLLSPMEQELLTIFRSIDNTNLQKVGLDQLKCLLSINIE